MESKRKIRWQEIYSIILGTGLLLVLGASEAYKNKQNALEQTTIQEETKQDSVPQVNNYPFDDLIGPVWRDPISNVYPAEQ